MKANNERLSWGELFGDDPATKDAIYVMREKQSGIVNTGWEILKRAQEYLWKQVRG